MDQLPQIPNRNEIASEFQQHGGRIAGVLPIHYPRALLRAFNYLPMEVWGPPAIDTTFGEAHLQPYLCSIMRNALSFLNSKAFEIVDLVLVPHACDSLQGMASLLLDFLPPSQPVVPFYLPRGHAEGTLDFLSQEIRSLYARLEGITDESPSVDDLMAAILNEERADEALKTLHMSRATLNLSNIGFYRLIRTREYLPAEKFFDLAVEVLGWDEHKPSDGIPIMLSGILPEPMQLLRSIDEIGGVIIADDLACSGRRIYPPGESEDPFQRMAESIVNSGPDWNHGSPIPSRLDHLVHLCRQHEARGVIFYNVKFCEPELHDHPALREGLKQKGIQSTVIEVDINDPVSNQLLTRVEALLELLA